MPRKANTPYIVHYTDPEGCCQFMDRRRTKRLAVERANKLSLLGYDVLFVTDEDENPIAEKVAASQFRLLP